MKDYSFYSKALLTQGFAVINNVYSAEEVAQIAALIDNADQSNNTFRMTSDLFAIRKCLTEIPKLLPVVFNLKIKEIISGLLEMGILFQNQFTSINRNNQIGL